MYFNTIIELFKRNNGNCIPNYCYPSERIFIEKEKTGAVNNSFFFFFFRKDIKQMTWLIIVELRVKLRFHVIIIILTILTFFFHVILYKNDFSAI